ncbi:30S ribosomal protein S15 [Linum grandiflorum]
MALTLSRANHRPLASTSLINQIISPSPLSSPLSTVPHGNDNTSSSAAAGAGVDSQPDHNPAASYLNEVKSSLREDQRSPNNRPYPSARNPSGGPVAGGGGSALDSISKHLSEFRKRIPPPSGNNDMSAEQRRKVSVEDIYNRNVQDGASGENRRQMTFGTIKESLRALAAKNANNANGDSTRPWNTSRMNVNGANSVRSTVINGARGGGGMPTFGKIEGGMLNDFGKSYSYEELGALMKKLRPEVKQKAGGGKKGLFSLQELSERLSKIKEMEEEKSSKSPFGIGVLRQGFEALAALDEQKKQGPIYRASILSPSPPEYTMHPPKDELVEKYFHPDNMSSEEKMKIELAKVREEFKMSESDCGSARVQVAQLTTKIKHLSSVLHKKDKHSRKGLQEMVQKRKKLLRYLRRTDWDSFCFVLTKLGLRDNPDYKNL